MLKDRGVTTQGYIDALLDFDMPAIGDEVGAIIGSVAFDLEKKPERDFMESTYTDSYYSIGRDRYKAQSALCAKLNAGRPNPLTLEAVLNFTHEPAAARYDEHGDLYVIDTQGNLHLFRGKEEINQWQLALKGNEFLPNYIGDLVILPSIAVHKDLAFLTSSGGGLEKFSLHDEPIPREGIIPYSADALGHRRPDMRITYHDVLIKGGNVFVSTTNEHGGRRISQVLPEGTQKVYSGQYPVRWMKNSFEDHTLRLGLHQENLYFPEDTGLSVLTPQGPKEMLGEYVRRLEEADTMNPCTKFTFGSDFLAASVQFREGKQLPMLTIFTPVYHTPEGALADPRQPVYPDRFSLRHVQYLPKITGKSIVASSFAAHGNHLAITHPGLHKTFLYRVDV